MAAMMPSTGRLDDVLRALLQEIVEGLRGVHYEFVALTAYDADRNFVNQVNRDTTGSVFMPGRRPSVEVGVDAVASFPHGVAYRLTGNNARGAMELANAGLDSSWSIPLISAGVSYGMVTLCKPGSEPFSENELAIARQAVANAAHPMALIHQDAILSREASRRRLIEDLSRLPAGSESPDAVFARMMNSLPAALPHDYAHLTFRNAAGDYVLAGAEPVLFLGPGESYTDGQADYSRVLALGSRVTEYRTDRVAGFWPDRLREAGIGRVLLGLALSDGRIVATLTIGRQTHIPFSPQDVALLDLLVTLLGQAVENRERLDRERAAEARSALLNRIGVLLHGGKPIDEVFEELYQCLAAAVPFDYVSLIAPSGQDGFFSRLASYPELVNKNGELISLADSQYEAIVATGRTWAQYEPGLVQGPSPSKLAAAGLKRGIGLALSHDGAPLGILSVARRSPALFSDTEIAFLDLLGTMLSQSIATQQLVGRLEREAAFATVLNDLALGLKQDGSPPAFFAQVAQALPQVLHHDYLWLGVRDNNGSEDLRVIGGGGDPASSAFMHRLAIGSLAAGTKGQVLREYRSAAWPRPDLAPPDGWGRVELAVLGDDTAPLGVLGIAHSDDRPMRRDERRFLHVLASLLSQSLAHMQKLTRDALHKEQLEQAARLTALGELVASVAHELNNPLTAVVGFADVIELEASSEHRWVDDLRMLRREALRARDIVRDLLFIARPPVVERGPVDLPELFRHIVRLRGQAWRRAGLEAELELPSGLHVVAGAEAQLTQVFLNLITNAEHALRGQPNPRIRIRLADGDGQTVVSITDNGVGIPPEVKARVFEPLFSTKHGEGNGLGLSISYGIVAAHGGQLTVESEPGQGSTFRVALPWTEAARGENTLPEHAIAGHRMNVLVIDDEPSIRQLSQRLLGRMGHRCVALDGTAELRATIREERFDLVICDYRLGAVRADDVLEILASEAPELVDRTVIVTGATTEENVIRLVSRHGLRLMPKPFGLAELRQVLREFGSALSA